MTSACVAGFAATFLGFHGALSAQSDEYALTDVQLFDPQRVIEVKVELAPEDWDALRAQTRGMVAALGKTAMERPFDYFKGNVVVDGVRIEGVGVRKKGFIGSLSSSRPSLKIKFDEFVEQEPIRGLDRLTLNNNNQDRTVASQFLSYRFFEKVGVAAPRCNLAQVWVNGQSLGIYSHVESIRAPFLKRVWGDASGD
ncbi:MAG: CotH kinase family protein, partial [Planctomycetota bacterium]|nr:CotH kinase family protein [Planctomycetota bacterium]